MDKILINDVEYGWGQIRIASPALGIEENGEVIFGVTAISWNKKRDTVKLYGLGSKAKKRGFGNWECEASITFRTSVQIALRGTLNTLMELGEFDIIVNFDSEFETEDAVVGNNTVVLKGCMFSEDGFDAKQGDMEAEKTFDLNVMDIQYN